MVAHPWEPLLLVGGDLLEGKGDGNKEQSFPKHRFFQEVNKIRRRGKEGEPVPSQRQAQCCFGGPGTPGRTRHATSSAQAG